MTDRVKKETAGLLSFLNDCRSPFHVVEAVSSVLKEQAFTELKESEAWVIEPGKRYYVKRNGSSILAFTVGEAAAANVPVFQIVAAHTDAPTFKLKEKADLKRGMYAQLNTEGYGGMIASTWMDRPLSIAGRAYVKKDGRLQKVLVDFDRDLVLIPSMAIHMNRRVNEGVAFNNQVDMLPLFGDKESQGIRPLLAKEIGCSASEIFGSDLFLYNRMKPTVWGEDDQFVSAPGLDDRQCVYAGLQGLLRGNAPDHINMAAFFDNEEVGSGTKQGAKSTFLRDTMERILLGLGKDTDCFYRSVAKSFMISADNAHAVHPNHPEKTDPQNCVYMNEGVVIKAHAGQKYTSDAQSTAMFAELCEQCGVPVQFFANRSDEAGGSTLGNLSTGVVSLRCVDIGLPQLAMHSSYETSGTKDLVWMIDVFEGFFKGLMLQAD